MSNQKVQVDITANDLFSAVMNGVIAGMAKAKQSADQLNSAVKQSVDQTTQAFKTLNIRSAFDIRAEQNQIITAFNEIKNSGKASAEEVARAQEAMKSKLRGLQDELNATKTASNSAGMSLADMFKNVGRYALAFNSIISSVQTAWQGLLDISRPAMELQKLNAMFKASSGSAELAAKDMAYVRAESNRLGLVFQDTAGSFSKFAAGMRNTSLEGQKTKDIFSAVGEASTALQLSADQTNGILLAFTQIMGKGRVSAEELNQVAERLPGAIDLISSSMGMTTKEFRKAAEEGRVLSADVLERIPKALRDLYGAAAMDAANGPAAQMNRLKTATFELMAVLGQKPLQVVGNLASALTGLANSAKSAAEWLAHSAWGESLANIASGLGFLATALAVAAGGQAIYTAATWAAATATGAFTLSLLANPLVLAFGAAVIGVVAALSALANAFDDSSSASSRSSAAIKQTTEEMRKAAAERKQIEDNYEKAVGVSLERQIAKRKEQYDQDVKAVEAKFSQELKGVTEGSDAEKKLVEKLSEDKLKIQNAYSADVDKIRKSDLQKQESDAATELKNKIEHLKRLGQTKDAEGLDIAAKNRSDLKAVEDYYKGVEDAAKASGTVLVGLESEKAAAIDQLRKKQALDAAQRGYESGKKELEAYRGIMDSKAALMTAAAGTDIKAQQAAQVEIERMEIDFARRRFQTAAAHFQDVAALYPKDSDQYRAALNDMTSAHKSYLDTSSASYRKYADEIKAIDQQIKDFRMSVQQKIADLQQKNMTDAQKFADNQRRMNEALAKAEVLKAQGLYDEAMKYNKQAEDLASRLDSNVAVATEGLNRVLQQGESILEAKKDAPQQALNKLKELDAIALKEKSLRVVMDDTALGSVKGVLDSLTETATKTIIVKTVGTSGEASFSDTASGYFTGGKVTNGSPLRDSVHAMLAGNEWVINNKATGFWGDNLLAAVNAPFSAAGVRLQQALNVSAPAPATPAHMGTINLDLAGGSYPVSAPMDVLAELNTALRRRKMSRPNP